MWPAGSDRSQRMRELRSCHEERQRAGSDESSRKTCTACRGARLALCPTPPEISAQLRQTFKVEEFLAELREAEQAGCS